MVLLNLEEEFGKKQLKEIIEARFKNIPQLQKVIVRMKAEYFDYSR